ncbi:MAG: hypothetical protein GY847_27280 [Proteobacteria bacterium]|nr:hypothetical protein [Pseudomonadota bacterium]
MIIVEKKQFVKGLAMALIFLAILAYMFSPSFEGENAFRASDKLFNSIAKGSTNYFPKLKEQAIPHKDQSIDVLLKISDKKIAVDALKILKTTGADANMGEGGITVKGTLGQIVDASLKDAETMFYNRGEEISKKYEIEEKQALFAWWNALKEMGKALNGQERFKEAAFIEELINRGVEVGYNFYKIEPQDAVSKAFILCFLLVFYVLYTLWWGFAIFFLAEGIGLQLTAGAKKET